VLFHTPWRRSDDGWSIAARAYARAMALGGLDVHLLDWAGPRELLPKPTDEVLDEVRGLTDPVSEWDCRILSCVVEGGERMRRVLGGQQLGRGPQGFHCVFERQQIDAELAELLNGLEGVWAQCSFNRDVLRACGVRRVALIPQPYFDDDPLLAVPPPSDSRRFYWIGRFEPRKAPDLLVRAFLRAFKPGEATLTLKLSPYPHDPGPRGRHYPSAEEVILHELYERDIERAGWTPRSACTAIRVVRQKLSRSQMLLLHANHDVYCSASRGEGLDLPAFAAKLAGRKLCVTDSGGPRDFVADGDEIVPTCGSVAADASYPWPEGSTYADFRLEDLVAALQRARGSEQRGARVPEAHRSERVGQLFREWVGELCGRD
jgi:glycosyltransferase involved in cell wall biosynthesis